jgi:hypothetical protein
MQMLAKHDPEMIRLCSELWNVNKLTEDPIIRRNLVGALTGNLRSDHGIAPNVIEAWQSAAGQLMDSEVRSETLTDAAQRAAIEVLDSGLAQLHDVITPEKAREACRYLDKQPMYDEQRFGSQPGAENLSYFYMENRPPDTFRSAYGINSVFTAPWLLDAVCHQDVLDTFQIVFGCCPTIVGAVVWRTVPGNVCIGPEIMHRDRDCFGFFKLFIYLNDVDETCGPHIFLKWTHTPEALATCHGVGGEEMGQFYKGNGRHLGDAYLEERFSKGLTRLIGQAGSTFVGNTYAFHRGSRPTAGQRVILTVTYSVLPLRYSQPKERVNDFDRPYDLEEFLSRPMSPTQRYALRLYTPTS